MAGIGATVALIKALAPKADPSVIRQAVEDYLETHPEISVADGSITEAKLAADVAGILDDLQDDTEICKESLTVESGTNYLPTTKKSQFHLGYYLEDGEIHEGSQIGYIDQYIEVKPEQAYLFRLVPAFGAATSPWYGLIKYGEVYDKNKNFIANIDGNYATGAFSTPANARYIRVNTTGLDWNSDGGKVIATGMLVEGTTVPTTYVSYDIQKQIIQAGLEVIKVKKDLSQISKEVDERTLYESLNLYDPSIQTPTTISPHYFVNGVPYSSTQFDTAWNCTAPIDIEPNTQYSLGLVPAIGEIVKPWHNASHGAFFYDEDGVFISGTTNTTFTTPANAHYLRFNYYISGNTVTLNILNAKCMLVKSDTLPGGYVPYSKITIKEKLESIGSKINYVVENDGESVTLITKYNSSYDMAVTVKKKGGNNLFDFYKFGLISNSTEEISKDAEQQSNLMTTDTDWFAPFIFHAKNNADGDKPSSYEFTGGNHQYNNQGSGSTATARTSALVLKADNRVVASGSGSCSQFEMIWTNLVQASNTKKEDGTGREVLQENHRMIFDGNKFEFFVDLLPLEDLSMQTWYGAQWSTNGTVYPKVRYIGGADREEHTVSSAASSSGDSKCCHAVGYGDTHEIRLDIDDGYDLGDHSFISSEATNAIFTATYGKGYCSIINNKDLDEGEMYSLHGWYQFRSIA